jgi:hypothetical protein
MTVQASEAALRRCDQLTREPMWHPTAIIGHPDIDTAHVLRTPATTAGSASLVGIPLHTVCNSS